MKKTFTLLTMLLASFATAGAQTQYQYYATTATPYANLESGKSYAIRVAADKNCDGTDYSNAKFLSGSGTSQAQADASTSTNDLRGKAVATNYTWVVTVNTDQSITLQVSGGNYIPAAPSNGHNGGQLSTTAGQLTRVAVPAKADDATWCQLKSAGTFNTNQVAFLTLGGSKGSTNRMEYWTYSETATSGEIAKFQFYEVMTTETAYDVTYNYTINGTQVGTYTTKAAAGAAYPTPGNLPNFVTAATPEGTVTEATTKTIEVDLSSYPFPFSLTESETPHWGYLTGNISTRDRKIYTNSTSTIVRAAGNGAYQNTTLNGVADDLWRMVGNPFTGFKVMNKSGKCFVKQSANNGATYATPSSTESDNLWKVYGGDIISADGSITDANKAELKAKAFILCHANATLQNGNVLDNGGVSGLNIGTWNMKSNGACFLFLEPEFTVDLNTTDGLVASFATLALPFDFAVASSNTTDAKLYTGAYNADNATLDMTDVSTKVIPANSGILIKSDSKAANIVLTANAKATETSLSGNQLVGTTSEIAFADLTDKLVFGVTTDNFVGFYTASGTAALPANRAYLAKSILSGTNAVALNFDATTTAINHATIATENGNAPIYDLSGRRVMRAVKGGLYIQNGKKYIAR